MIKNGASMFDRKKLLFFNLFILIANLLMMKRHLYTGDNPSTRASKRTLILYAYFEKNPLYPVTLDYFLKMGVTENANIDYVFIIQGGVVSVEFPKYSNLKIFKRENNCFDFGAYGAAIEWLGGINNLENKYDAIMFINPSAMGPILPKYWPSNLHWIEAFTSRLNGNVHAVGTSIVCLPETDLGKLGPRIEGMVFAATIKAVKAAIAFGAFKCHKNKVEAIVDGEYGFSQALIKEGLNIDTLLLQYGNLNWLDKKNWYCNRNVHPTRKGTYGDGMTVHPLETIFYKPIWIDGSVTLSKAYSEETTAYMKWALERKRLEY